MINGTSGERMGVLVVLRCHGNDHLLLAVRPVRDGAITMALPTGTFDDGAFVGSAAEALGRAGHAMTASDLTDLSTVFATTEAEADDPVSYSLSPDGSGQGMRFSICRRNITAERFAETKRWTTDETVGLKLVPLDRHIRRIPDGATQIAIGLYQEILLAEILSPYPLI